MLRSRFVKSIYVLLAAIFVVEPILPAVPPEVARASDKPATEQASPLVSAQPETVAPGGPVYHPATRPAQASASSVVFVENKGQFGNAGSDRVAFKALGSNGNLALTPGGMWLTLLEAPKIDPRELLKQGKHPSAIPGPNKAVGLRFDFQGADPHPRLEGFDPLKVNVSYFTGSDSSLWHPDVPTWGGVRYLDLYPGADLELQGDGDQLAWQLVVKDEAKSFQNGNEVAATVRIDGAKEIALSPDGKFIRVTTDLKTIDFPLLKARLANGTPLTANPPIIQGKSITFSFSRPAALSDAASLPILAAQTLQGSLRARLLPPHPQSAEAAPAAAPLASGPGDVLSFNLLSGANEDRGWAVTLDASDGVYIAGTTYSNDFPATVGDTDCGSSTTTCPPSDAFVAKYTISQGGSATLAWVTFLGGAQGDWSDDVKVGSSGAVYVVGETQSSDFPVTANGFDTSFGGGACGPNPCSDAFVTALTPLGNGLTYSSFLGGSSLDYATALAIGPTDKLYVAGETLSADFPTVVSAYNTSFTGDDGFLAILDTTATGSAQLTYATFLGGSSYDVSTGVTVDKDGIAYVAGITWSPDYPITPTAFDPTCDSDNGSTCGSSNAGSGAPWEGTLSKIDPRISGTAGLLYSTYVGGYSYDYITGLAIDSAGNAYVTGDTESPNFPLKSGYDMTHGGECDLYTCNNWDVFVAKIDATKSGSYSLVYSTLLGGSDYEDGGGIFVRPDGSAFVSGDTSSTDGPFNYSPPPGSNGFSAIVAGFDPSGRRLLYAYALPQTYAWGYGIAMDANGLAYVVGGVGPTSSYSTNDAFLAVVKAGAALLFGAPSATGVRQADRDFENYGAQAQAEAGDPINTYTGKVTDYSVDLSVPTQAGALTFSRSYSTFNARLAATGNSPLGVMSPGWNHNYEVYLTFPQGSTNIILQSSGGSQITFHSSGTDTYSPETGYGGTLTRAQGPNGYLYNYRNAENVQYVFDSSGKLTAIDNGLGHQILFQYDDVTGRLTTVAADTLTSPAHFLRYRYDTQGRLLRVGDQSFNDSDPNNPTGRYVELGYSSFGPGATDFNLSYVRDVRGKFWYFGYPSSAPTGLEYMLHYVETRYGASPTTVGDPTGLPILTRFEYDSNSLYTDPITTLSYVRATKETRPDVGETAVSVDYSLTPSIAVKYGTTVNGQLVGVPANQGYIPPGVLGSETFALGGGGTSTHYDSNLRTDTFVDGNNNTHTIQWSIDGGHIEKTTDPALHDTLYAYDSDNHLLQITQVDGSKTIFVWTGNLLSTRTEQSADGSLQLVTQYQYTNPVDDPTQPANLLKRIVAPDGVTCFVYNAAGQQTDIYHNCVDKVPGPTPDEDVLTHYDYDYAGRLERVTDALGRQTLYRYLDGNTIEGGDDLPDEVITNYDGADLGNPANYYSNNGLNNLSTRTYRDDQGRVVAIVTNYHPGNVPDGNPATFNFGGAQITLSLSATHPEFNQVTLTRYDGAGRVIETVTHYDGSDLNVAANYYKNNGLNNLSTRTFYDKAGRVVATVAGYNPADIPGGGAPAAIDFDGDGSPDATLEISTEHPEYNRIARTSYDSAGRVSTTTAAAWPGQPNYYLNIYNLITAYEHDRAGNLTKTITNFDPDLNSGTPGYPNNYPSYSVSLKLNYGGAQTVVQVDPDAPDRNVITCVDYDDFNRPFKVVRACIPDVFVYLKVGDNLYNVATFITYDTMGRQTAVIRNWVETVGPMTAADIVAHYPDKDLITKFYYDKLGRVEYQVSNFVGDLSSTAVPTYDPSLPDRNLVTRFIHDSSGRQIAVVHNLWGSALDDDILTAQEFSDSSPDRNQVTRTYYDGVGRVSATVTNFVGTIADSGLPSYSSSTPDQNLITRYVYDTTGRVTDTIQDRGAGNTRTTSAAYDILNRTTQNNQTPGGLTTTYTYASLGLITTATDQPVNRTRRVEADALGRARQSAVDPGGLNLITTATYDAAGQAIQVIDSSNRVVTTKYDALGRVIQTSADPGQLNLTTATSYDLLNQPIEVTSPQNIKTRRVYDTLGQLVQVIQNAQGTFPTCTTPATSDVNVCIHFEYDAAGRLVKRTLGNGSVTSYQVDALGRQKFEWVDPGGKNLVTEACYDGAGNRVRTIQGSLVGYTLSNGVITSSLCATADASLDAVYLTRAYTYDALGRVTQISYRNPPVGASYASTPTVHYTYDDFGNRASMTDGTGSWSYSYDNLNDPTAVNGPPGNVSYAYNPSGQRTSLTAPGLALSYTYDAAGRLDTITNPFGTGSVDYNYTGGTLAQVIQPGGISTAYNLDGAGRLDGLVNGPVGSPLSSFGYTLDARGNRTDADEALQTPLQGFAPGAPNAGLTTQNESHPPLAKVVEPPLQDGATATPTVSDLFQTFYHDLDAAQSQGAISTGGVYISLLTKAQNAEASYAAGDVDNARNTLNALLNELQADAGNQVQQPYADMLIADVLAILGYVGGGATTTPSPSPTGSATPTGTPTDTPTPTGTSTTTSTVTATLTPTDTPTVTATPTSASTATPASGCDPTFGQLPLARNTAFDPQVVGGVLVSDRPDHRASFDEAGTHFAGQRSGQPLTADVGMSIAAVQRGSQSLSLVASPAGGLHGWSACDNLTLRDRGNGLFEASGLYGDHIQTAYVLQREPLPGQAGQDITLNINLTPTLQTAETTPQGILLLDSHLNGVLIGRPTAVDAAGRTLTLDMSGDEAGLTITLPASWLAQATYPVVIDPVIITWTHSADAEYAPFVRYDSSGGRALVAFTQKTTVGGVAHYDVRYRLIDAVSGAILYPQPTCTDPYPSAAITTTGDATTPVVSYNDNSSPKQYLVAYGRGGYLREQRVDAATGAPIGSETGGTTISLGSDVPSDAAIDTASGGTQRTLVVWGNLGLKGALFNPDGTLYGNTAYTLVAAAGGYTRTQAHATFDPSMQTGGRFIISYKEVYDSGSGTTVSIKVRRVTTTAGTDGSIWTPASQATYHFANRAIVYNPISDADVGGAGRILEVWTRADNNYLYGTVYNNGSDTLTPAASAVVIQAGQINTLINDKTGVAADLSTAAARKGWVVTWRRRDYTVSPASTAIRITTVSYAGTVDSTVRVVAAYDPNVAVVDNPVDYARADGTAVTIHQYTLAPTTSNPTTLILTLNAGSLGTNPPTPTPPPSCTPTATLTSTPTNTPAATATDTPTATATATDTPTNTPTPTDTPTNTPTATNTSTPTPTPTPTLPPSPPPAEGTHHWHYTYDGLGRLTAACPDWNSSTSTCNVVYPFNFTYSYDGAGNLTRFDRWNGIINRVDTVDYVYNGANQVKCIDAGPNPDGACGAGEFLWGYDAYGNLLNDGATTYTYDAANRLKTVTASGVTTSYVYDGDGDRISQTVGTTTTTYVLDPASSLTKVLSETTSGQTTRYFYGFDLVAQSNAAGVKYLDYDGLGSVRQLSDATGAVNLAQTFDPYGNGYSSAGSATSNYGYTGEQVDSDGFVYLRARYYNPSMGQFMQTDPSGFERNLYQYAGSNPVMYGDPSGQCYGLLSPLRDAAPEWCHNIDNANGVVSAGIIDSLNTGKPLSTESVRALGYIVGSGMVVSGTLDLAAVGLVFAPEATLTAGGVGAIYGLGKMDLNLAFGNPQERAWAMQHGYGSALVDAVTFGAGGGTLGVLNGAGGLWRVAGNVGLTGLSALGAGNIAGHALAEGRWPTMNEAYDLAWSGAGIYYGAQGTLGSVGDWVTADVANGINRYGLTTALPEPVRVISPRWEYNGLLFTAYDPALDIVNYRAPASLEGVPGNYQFRNPYLQAEFPQGVDFYEAILPNGDTALFPDLSPYTEAVVHIRQTGNSATDLALADQQMRLLEPGWQRPEGYTWHHVEDRTTMLLVRSLINADIVHMGGASLARNFGMLVGPIEFP